MAGRKPAYRRKRHNLLGMFLVTTCIAMMLVVVSISSVNLKKKQRSYAEQKRILAAQIESEHERTQEIAEREKYMKTDAYVEQIAKDKLGLVYEGEIIFKVKE